MKKTRNIVIIIRNLLILLGVIAISAAVILKVSSKYNFYGFSDDAAFAKKKSWAGQYLSGYHATQIKDYEKASQFFARSVNLDNSTEFTQTQTMNLLVVTGKFKDAFRIADHLYQNNQNTLAAIIKIIKEVEYGNYKSADIIANQISKSKEGATVINQVIFAWVKFGNGNYLAAKNIFESMQDSKRYLPFINYHYALVADLAGKTQEAEKLFNYLAQIENPPVSIASATYNFFKRTKNNKMAELVAQNYGKDRETHLVLYHNIPDAKRGIAEALADTGTIIMTEYKDDSAATFFRLALFLAPNFDEAKLLLANILMNQGDYNSANKLLKNISEKSSVYNMAKLGIAKNYEEMKEDAKAKQYYEKLAENESTKLDALINLGDLKREAENYEEAIDYYTQALNFGTADAKKTKDDLDDSFWAIYFARGVCYERLGKWTEAEKDLKQALEMNPEQPDVLNYLGYSWIDTGKNIEEGINYVSRAYELKPEDSHILDSVGWGYFKLGDYENALSFLEAAITQMPYDATVNEHLGDVYWRLGRKTEAKYQWQRALDNKPEKKAIAALETKIKSGMPEEAASSKPHKANNIAAHKVLEQLIQSPAQNSDPEEMEGTPEEE